MAGKEATKFAKPVIPELLIRQSVAAMTPEQFAAYDAALRSRDYYAMNPDDQANYTIALQAANARRQADGFNVTIRDGNRASVLPSLPGGLQWAPLIALAVVLLLASRL